jgi:2-oxoglutarate dehydrogenase E2 component (dihydrolipoamide succinyltransferase)
MATAKETVSGPTPDYSSSERFYSPLVRNIAREEGISLSELDALPGTGKEGRVTKNDILAYLEQRKGGQAQPAGVPAPPQQRGATPPAAREEQSAPAVQAGVGDELIPMTRMGKLIAQHMTESVATSAHVQSFIEVDVTNIVQWRAKVKGAFEKREGEKLTFTPIFMEAVAKALKNFPMVNISVDGDNIIRHKNINIGMAAALPDGNLIVPVIKNADQLNLVGMAKVVNDLANRARNNALKPDEVKDGTYTVTNVGSFGSVFGTPIINQPQVGILALGAIRKMPSVIETEDGDFIGIRSKMFLSHSYDHRVVNGALGGMFVKSVADYLENWDVNREI